MERGTKGKRTQQLGTARDGHQLARGFTVSAAQAPSGTTLGVKGSQVQILSSRQMGEGPLRWITPAQRASRLLGVDHQLISDHLENMIDRAEMERTLSDSQNLAVIVCQRVA
jgi:hypothetical protein